MSKGTIMFKGVDYSSAGGNPANNYSTEEQVIGTWIDGKPLYQKTVVVDSLISDGDVHVYPHGVSNVDVIFITDGVLIGTYGLRQPWLTNTNGNFFNWYPTVDGVMIDTMHPSGKLIFTIQYTKTTD